MTRRLVKVAFSGDREGKLHRATSGGRVGCGTELTHLYTGWFPADLCRRLATSGHRLCRAQGCFHSKAQAKLMKGELGKLSKGGRPP